MCRAPATPAPLPGTRWPAPAPPRRAAAARASTRAAELASPCSHLPCLFLNLKHVLELLVNSLLHLHTPILPTFLLPELSTSPEPCRSLGSPSTAAAAASHPRSSALVAPQQPTEAHKPAQFHSPALDRPDHSAGELELPPPLGLTVVPTIYCFLTPAKQTTSTTSSRRSFPATFPPLSCPPATRTPSTSLGAPPPASVRR
jgi:hypothetical protein